MISLVFTAMAVFLLVVVVHEFGHYIAARLLRMPVAAFQVGFGPRILSFRDHKNTEWELRLIPLLGFLRISATGTGLRDSVLYSRSITARIIFYVAGPLASVVLGIGLLAGATALFGEVAPSTVVTEVSAEAQAAGIEVGDRIVRVDGVGVRRATDVVTVLQTYGEAGRSDPLAVDLEADGNIRTIAITPSLAILPDGTTLHRLGLVFGKMEPVSDGADPTQALHAVSAAISGMSVSNLTGPVGMSLALDTASSGGLAALMFLAGALSIGLGIVNLLPIPVLDGGNVAMCVIEAVVGPERMRSIQPGANFVGLSLIIFLLLFATYSDISRLL